MWTIIYEKKTIEDIGEYTAYGVRNLTFCIGDICTSPDEIRRLVKVLNDYDVSPENAMDIVEDYLAEGFPEEMIGETPVTA